MYSIFEYVHGVTNRLLPGELPMKNAAKPTHGNSMLQYSGTVFYLLHHAIKGGVSFICTPFSFK